MPHDVRITISCPDKVGLLAAISARLFDLGGNLGDTSFAVLGESAEFTGVCELPDAISAGETQALLEGQPELADARIAVTPFELPPVHGPRGHATHMVEVGGADRPGLIARLSEAFAEYDANIVRMDSERTGTAGDYLVRFAVCIPVDRTAACLATITNTAQSLGLACDHKALPESDHTGA